MEYKKTLDDDTTSTQVFLKLWMTGEINVREALFTSFSNMFVCLQKETTIMLHKTLTAWEEDTLTWNSRSFVNQYNKL